MGMKVRGFLYFLLVVMFGGLIYWGIVSYEEKQNKVIEYITSIQGDTTRFSSPIKNAGKWQGYGEIWISSSGPGTTDQLILLGKEVSRDYFEKTGFTKVYIRGDEAPFLLVSYHNGDYKVKYFPVKI